MGRRLAAFLHPAFWLWAIVGTGLALSLISFIGVVTILPTVIVGSLLAAVPALRRSAFGVLVGIGGLLLFVAYVNRDGPGTSCRYANGWECAHDLPDPRKWLAAGIVFIAAGLAAHAWRSSRA